MNILICGRYLNAPIGGAEISTRELIKLLITRDHKIAVFTISNDNKKKIDWPFSNEKVLLFEGIFPRWLHKKILPGDLMNLIIEAKMNKVLDNICRQFKPDLILSNNNLLIPSNYDSAEKVFFVHDFGFGSSLSCSSFFRALLNLPFAIIRRKKLCKFDLITSNSNFVKNIIKRYGINSKIVYPFIDFSKYFSEENCNKPYITFIRPTYQKGAKICLKIIRALPGKQFLIVSNLPDEIKNELSDLKNVTYIPWTSRMDRVYFETKLIIAPSIVNETFGRVIIEAAVNGIPAIASKRGGLIESVGDGGILIEDIWNIDGWVNAIELMDDEAVYSKYSAQAKINSRKFLLNENMAVLIDTLDAKFGIKI